MNPSREQLSRRTSSYMLQLSQIRLCQYYSMIGIESVRACFPIRLCALCVLAVKSSTMTLEQRSVGGWFAVSALSLYRQVLFFV